MRRIGLATALLFLFAAGPAAAQIEPDVRYRTVESEHFRLSYSPGLDTLALRAVDVAEAAYAYLVARLGHEPATPIDIVLADNQDLTNGTAGVFPSNRIRLWARPAVGVAGLDFNADWLELVIVHELTHIFHLDVAGGLGRTMRAIFGRLPLLWPMFPAVGSPRWTTEGLAVVYESEATAMGRARGSYHRMVVRTDALEDGIEAYSRVNAISPIWPGGERPYIYGSLFLDWLRSRQDSLGKALLDATASAVLPPLLFFDRVARRAIGRSWDDAYAEWRAGIEERAAILADSLRADGLTLGERITGHGYLAAHPRVSPDGSWLAYAALDGRNITATRLLALPVRGTSDAPAADVRRNTVGPTSWFPDGLSYLVSQLEYDGPYRIVSDLWRVDLGGSDQRLTHGLRLEDGDVSPDGERIVAVENGGGATRLVLLDADGTNLRPITPRDVNVGWDMPRWSPDGRYIAVSRWEQGGLQDVVVIDTTGAVLRRITADRAVDSSPAWSPDGRWILFSSDRTGIPNLYAADWRAEPLRLRQVTRVLTGAFEPDVTPSGTWIHYVEYHGDGYHLARLPFDPRSWRDAPQPAPGYGAASADLIVDATTPRESRAYSAWQTLAPQFWSPVLYDTGITGTMVGAATAGEDIIGRHAFAAFAAINPESGVWQGSFAYDYAGFGQPVLSLQLVRDHDFAGRVLLPDSTVRSVSSAETTASLLARFLRRQWRWSTSFALGIEGVSERRTILDAPGFQLVDRVDELVGGIVRVGFANWRQQPFSISQEDGIATTIAARVRREIDSSDERDGSYNEVTGLAAAYRSFDWTGFARHVIAARASALWRAGDGASLSSIGGQPGQTTDVLGFQLGESRLLPVRGFDPGDRVGSRAWTASLEYRFPVALVGERPWWSPLFLDRVSGTLFIDAGNAWCGPDQRERFAACPGFDDDDAIPPALVSAGGELVIDAGLSFLLATRLRVGAAAALQGPDTGLRAYISLGPSF